jgi:hypothetical protein
MLRRWDALLLAGLLVAGAILYIIINYANESGAWVDVVVDGKPAASYKLDVDREVRLNFNGHNLLVIKDGTASVTDADCPDKLCVKQRSISKNGETIICLPHRVVVKIRGGEETGIDGVVQ